LWAGLRFDDVVFFSCFFLTVFFWANARLARVDFFAGFEVAVFDFACLLFVIFFLDAMAAVYHWSLSVLQFPAICCRCLSKT
jgi:hypothetical protein